MGVDYAEAFRASCKDSPRAAVERTEIEAVVSEMCEAVTKEAAKVFELPDGRGPALRLVCLTHQEEAAKYAPQCAIPADHGRVYIMHGESDRVKDVPAVHGVELLTYRRGPLGYPARVVSFDGKEALCPARTQLEAALASIVRSPASGARIRNAARDFIARQQHDQ